jgi:hypothetical protein
MGQCELGASWNLSVRRCTLTLLFAVSDALSKPAALDLSRSEEMLRVTFQIAGRNGTI